MEFTQFLHVRYAATINSLKKRKVIFLHSISKFIKLSKKSQKEEIEDNKRLGRDDNLYMSKKFLYYITQGIRKLKN